MPAAFARARSLLAPALQDAIGRLSPELWPAVRHHLNAGGKHVRATLALLSAAAAGADEPTGLPAAVAIELVHNFSLVHDDIVDGDRERRHQPTVWAKFGQGTAIIAGDALVTLAVQVLLAEETPGAVRAARVLADATQEMIAGQADDMAFERRADITVAECLTMEARKTGALLGCAASIGAILADAPVAMIDALADYGRHLGLAFQAVDDLLGVWGRSDVTGKPVGGDLRQHKKTLPIATAIRSADGRRAELLAALNGPMTDGSVRRVTDLLATYDARRQTEAIADENLAAALVALDRVPLAPSAAAQLAEIARFVVERDR